MTAWDDRSDARVRRIVRTRGFAHAAKVAVQLVVAAAAIMLIDRDDTIDRGLPAFIRLGVLVVTVELGLSWVVDAIAERYRRPIVDAWLASQAAGPGLRLEVVDREQTGVGRLVWLGLLIVIAVLVWLVLGNVISQPGNAVAIGVVALTFVVLWAVMDRDGARVPSLSVQPIGSIRIDRRGLTMTGNAGEARSLPWHEIRRISKRSGPFRARLTIESISDRRRARIPLQLREPISQEPVDLIRVVEAIGHARFERVTRLVPFGLSTSLSAPGLVEA